MATLRLSTGDLQLPDTTTIGKTLNSIRILVTLISILICVNFFGDALCLKECTLFNLYLLALFVCLALSCKKIESNF